jgi:hypothetical protein
VTETNHHSAATAELSDDGSKLTVSVPLTLRWRSGRKRIMTPLNEPDWKPPHSKIDSTLVKALSRAFRWKRLLDKGHYGSIVELADAEQINEAYVRRILRLALLAPPVVDAILDGRQPPNLRLEDLRGDLPVDWREQCQLLQSDS